MKNFKKLWKWLSRYKVRVWLALLLGIGTSVGSVLAALSIANILNAIIQQDAHGFLVHSLISAGLFMMSILSSYLYDRNATKIKQWVAYDIRLAMVESVEQATYRQYKTNKSEAYAAMLVTDLDIVSTRILDTFFKIVQNFFNLVASIVGLVYLHVSLLVTAFVLAALLFTLPGVFQGKMQVLAKQVAEKNNQLLVTASHWFGGFDVLNDVNAKSHIVSHVVPSIEAVKSTKIKDGNTTALVNMVSGTLSMVAQVAMIILTGYLALRGIVSSGTVLSTGNLAGMIFGPLSVLVMFYAQFQSGFGTLSHIEDTIATLTQPDAQTTALTLHEPASLTTHDLAVTFEDGRSVSLPNITATGNRHYAIVGPSGVGKSVFLNILAKNISDYTGELYVNDVALSTLSERSVKDLVAYVPQTTYIFNMTAKENILLANPTVTEAAYQEVVRLAGLQSVFEEWVNGDATLIGDTNTAISGGQAQRIGIARALIQQKPIMLFDEVTANLDPEVALAIEHVIHGIPNRLKLSVTHHLTQTNRALYDDVIEFKGTASS